MNQRQAFHVVTGASSGIGRAVAQTLAARGESVVAAAGSAGPLAALADQAGGRVVPIVAHVATHEGRRAIVEAVPSGATLAGLVHAAGSLVVPEPYGDLEADDLTTHFASHVAAPIALNNLLSAGHHVGRVVYLDSYSANEIRVGWRGSSTIKAAAQMAARSAIEELTGSTVVRVYPKAVNTPLVQAVLAADPSPTRDAFRNFADRGMIAEPAEVGKFIARLLLDASDDELRSRGTWVYEHPLRN